MAWNEAKPYVTATGAPVRVGVQQIGKGNPRLTISIGKELFEEIDEPKSCNVFVGDGEESGLLMIQCDKDGAHKFRECGKGGATLKLNAIPGMPGKKMKPAGVKFEQLEAEDTGVPQISLALPW